jgi:hypothetical protein
MSLLLHMDAFIAEAYKLFAQLYMFV